MFATRNATRKLCIINSSLVSDIYVDDDNKLHKVIGGADTVLNFSNGSVFEGNLELIGNSSKLIVSGLPKTPKIIFIQSLTSVDIKGFYSESDNINRGTRNNVSIGKKPFAVTDTGFTFDVDNKGSSYVGKCYYAVSY